MTKAIVSKLTTEHAAQYESIEETARQANIITLLIVPPASLCSKLHK
jgi:hypothetical protein